jgi:CRP-like cAMP-binding protein
MVPRQRERSGPPPLDELSPVVLAAIASNHLLSVLSPDQQAELLSGSQSVRFGPGEMIVREGDTGESLFLLLRGKVAVLKRCEDGSDAQVSELGGGEVFGEMTLLLDAPRSATVQAVVECELLQVNRSCFGELLKRNPHLLDRLADQVEERQAELKAVGSTHARSQKSALLDTMRRLLMDLCG